MASIKDAIRICKRIMLTNLLTNDYSIALTPLLSGKHGIGKSQVAKSIANSLGGTVMVIEGGTLKEGEITGIPYQYKNECGETEFRFLPYYIVKRIQNAEKFLYKEEAKEDTLDDILNGEENKYSNDNLSFTQKLSMLQSGQIKPVILFFDEINRTDTTVFRELMNIILTRTVNGYRFPWWVFIIAAMNPSTQSSVYATNEMDPAQTDRFIKLKVSESAGEWVSFAVENHFEESLIDFISNMPSALSSDDKLLEDDEKPMPTPRGWHMVDLILKAKDKLDVFFTSGEQSQKSKDIRTIVAAKVGGVAANMFFASLNDPKKIVTAEDIFESDTDNISQEVRLRVKKQSNAQNAVTSQSIVTFIKDKAVKLNEDSYEITQIKKKISVYMGLLDMSSMLMFSQLLMNTKASGNVMLYEYFYDIFDDELLEMLQQNNINDALVRGEL